MNNAQLIVALDVDTFKEAAKIIDQLADLDVIFKVGSQSFVSSGPEIIRYAQSKNKKVFLDLKFHDIPNTVASAVKSAVSAFSPLFMMTVHTSGGKEMLLAAVEVVLEKGKRFYDERPLIVGVTVLTSTSKDPGTQELVLQRARLAKDSGLDGVVVSAEETAAIRRELGKDFLIVTPGIRPLETSLDDQKRVATPQSAVRQGSNFLVVGRPIIQAASPRTEVLKILEDMKKG
jgi:orotidine-5'-phosphate decarboxylase